MAPPSSEANHMAQDEEDILQAVILADSFNSRFKPLTVSTNRCLLPLCNQTLLEWTLECLVSSGVQEIFVFCVSHPEKVKAAIQQSKWSRPSSGIQITPIISREARSVGDAMRELDAKQILTGDFILINGDVVSTLSLDNVLREHKERRKVNKDAIMTMVFREGGSRDRPRPGADKTALLLDSQTSECLHYEYVRAGTSSFQVPREPLTKHTELDLHMNLIDCSIDICTVDVPALFTENFDYEDLRNDFVRGVLTSDLLSKSIFCHIAERGYATRVKDTKAYATVSKDVLSRRTFPLVPDADSLNYELRRGNVYVAKHGVFLSRTCRIGNHTLIDRDTVISDGVQIFNSVIQKGCSIGRDTKIRDSYIWDGAVIGQGCVIEESIIGENVRLLDGTKVGRGCLISEGAVLGPHVDVGEFRRISRDRPVDEENEGEERYDVEIDASILGQEALAYLWPEEEEAEDEEEKEYESARNIKRGRLGDHDSEAEEEEKEDSDDDSDDSDSDEGSTPSTSASAFNLSLGDDTIPSLSLDTTASDFRSECTQSLERAFAEGHTVENAAIELKTLRMASNVPLRMVKEVVVSSIVQRIKWDGKGLAKSAREVDVVVKRWGGLIEGLGGDDPVETLSMLQKCCETHEGKSILFDYILKSLYNNDMMEEDGIKAWLLNDETKGAAGSVKEECRIQGAKLLFQIKKLEEEEDDDDEESEEESE